jgi:CRP-like cAMP-binding protein
MQQLIRNRDHHEQIELSLAQSRLFSGADAGTLRRCQSLFRKKTFRRGSQVVSQGDPVRSVYFMASGYVRISYLRDDGQERSVAIVGAGEFIGEEALLGTARRPFSATVVEDCTVFRAPENELAASFNTNATLAMNLARHMSRRFGIMDSTELAQGRVRDRLLCALQRIASQCGERSNRGQRISVRLTHSEIATFIGSSRETVTASLAELNRSGFISRSSGGLFTIHIAPVT